MLRPMDGPLMSEAPDTYTAVSPSAEGIGVQGNDGSAKPLTACMRGGQIPVGPCSAAITAPWQGTAHAPPSCGHATTLSRNASGVWPGVRRIARSEGAAGAAAVGTPPAERPSCVMTEAAGTAPAVAVPVVDAEARRASPTEPAVARAQATIPKYDLAVDEEQDSTPRRRGAGEDHVATVVKPWQTKLVMDQPELHVGQHKSAAEAALATAAGSSGWQAPNAHGEAPRSRGPRGATPAQSLPANVNGTCGISLVRPPHPVHPSDCMTLAFMEMCSEHRWVNHATSGGDGDRTMDMRLSVFVHGAGSVDVSAR